MNNILSFKRNNNIYTQPIDLPENNMRGEYVLVHADNLQALYIDDKLVEEMDCISISSFADFCIKNPIRSYHTLEVDYNWFNEEVNCIFPQDLKNVKVLY